MGDGGLLGRLGRGACVRACARGKGRHGGAPPLCLLRRVLQGLPHGRGTAVYVNGCRFVGEFKAGVPHGGRGTLAIAHAKSGIALAAAGDWQEGRLHGTGCTWSLDAGRGGPGRAAHDRDVQRGVCARLEARGRGERRVFGRDVL